MRVIGNITSWGSVCGTGLVSIDGNATTAGDVQMLLGANVNGQIHAAGNLTLAGLVRVMDDGSTAQVGAGGTAQSLATVNPDW